MIAKRARLGFKLAAISCLLVGFALLVGGLLATVEPLARDFAQINNSLPPAPAADSRIQAGLKLTIASQILLAIAVLAGVGWGCCNLFVRNAERDGRKNDEPEGRIGR
jgi:hypothetical protein